MKTTRKQPRRMNGRYSPRLRPNEIKALITLYLLTFWLSGVMFHVKLAKIPARMPDIYPIGVGHVTNEAVDAPVVSVAAPEQEKGAEIPPKPVTASQGRTGLPSQEQKDATAIACAHSWEQHEAELTEKNITRGLYMTTCYTDLLAIADRESGFRNDAKNESSRELSYGAYQINLLAHPDIRREQAEDFVFAVNWTINRLHEYGYPVYRTHALQCHNGCGAGNGYALAVKSVADRFVQENM